MYEKVLQDTNRQLSDIIERQMNTLCRCSARRWQEEGERPTKYFYQCIKQRAKKRTIVDLEEDGNLLCRYHQYHSHIQRVPHQTVHS